MTIRDERELAQLLRDAAAAHHEYEQRTGVKDANWADWYAEHITSKLQSDQEHVHTLDVDEFLSGLEATYIATHAVAVASPFAHEPIEHEWLALRPSRTLPQYPIGAFSIWPREQHTAVSIGAAERERVVSEAIA